jgi:hypothetical protein
MLSDGQVTTMTFLLKAVTLNTGGKGNREGECEPHKMRHLNLEKQEVLERAICLLHLHYLTIL